MATGDQRLAEKSRRRARAVDSARNAADTIGIVEPGMSLFALTRGQFSMIDVIQHCLLGVGGGRVSVWTRCIAEYELECFAALLRDRSVTSALLVIDQSGEKRNPLLIQDWHRHFGSESVRVCLVHAKIATVTSHDEKMRLLIRGSCNLNRNPRLEQLDITEGGCDYDLVRRFEEALPILELGAYAHDEAAAASQIGRAWECGELEAFRGLRPWRP